MLRTLIVLLGLGLAALAAGLWVTRPQTADAMLVALAEIESDPARGEAVYWAAGCASCHVEPGTEDKLVLAGGEKFETEFGTFVAPNISSHPEAGIGGWTLAEFASAVTKGTSPDGRHYYPVFPYGSYEQMTPVDVADLWAFMQTLPASDRTNDPHQLAFPFSIRASLGGWKLLFAGDGWVRPADTPELERGRYLVEALGHCAECHTPRGALGGLDKGAWMTGAPNPSGRGNIPGLLPPEFGWSETDVAYYLETGFTPDFDSAGGKMATVVENTARLTPEDRAAIAAYISALGG